MSGTMKAIKLKSLGTAEVATHVPPPRLRNDYILAEARAWALNPTDVHQVRKFAIADCTIGCDWSGVILEVGANVTRFKPGDEVFGVCHGGR